MTRNVIAVDIDNTCHESDITMNRASMELFNSPFRWCQQNQWYTGGDQNMPLENALQVFERMHDRDMIFMTDPYVGTKEGLDALVAAGYEIQYFTDRKEGSHADTVDWLRHHDLPNPEGVYCSLDKRAALREVNDSLATIVDDRPRTLVYARYELGMDHVFSLRQPYNRNLSDIPGVVLRDTWRELSAAIIETLGTPITANWGTPT